MVGSKRRLVGLGFTATVLAGLLIGWTIGLIEADLVRQGEALIFVALGLLFLGSLVIFVAELVKVEWNST
ncbi:hypothetical protein HYG81_22330 (plasmid) [Natrinema zhouii]|uniref:hypothetical protein n=1 Tax=Natrinema zhouii TaxID=1710539 RepID=UPI001CFFA649|nr:hypothetical protein [Natrinema zhouii]UHQ98705.1 hypothetical protein HYG81_22330 [Natrinema zhouii]